MSPARSRKAAARRLSRRKRGPRGYPRPQLERAAWTSLNGPWDFAIDSEPAGTRRARSPGTRRSWCRSPRRRRPRASATPASTAAAGTGAPSPPPRSSTGERLLLHFGAVDYAATVWVNGCSVGGPRGRLHPVHRRRHRRADRRCRQDDRRARRRRPATTSPSRAASRTGSSSRTGSGTRARPASGRRSGWSACRRPASTSLRWTPNLERWEIGFEACLAGEERQRPAHVRACSRPAARLLADDSYTVVAGEVHRRIALSDPGIDDFRNELLWSPATPTLIEARAPALGGRAASCSTRSRATRRCARSPSRATASCSTAGPIRCAWSSTRATGRTAA